MCYTYGEAQVLALHSMSPEELNTWSAIGFRTSPRTVSCSMEAEPVSITSNIVA